MATVMGHGPERGCFRGAIDGARVGWLAPTFLILNDIWDDLKKATRDAAIQISETLHKVVLPGGGSIQVRSGDNPDTASRGPGWDGVVIDEAAYTDKQLWNACVRPALSDRQGWAMFLTTPRGYNWFKELCDFALSRESWHVWKYPSHVNPLVTEQELAEALEDMGPTLFAQEHLAEFVDTEGAEFPSSYFPDSIWFDDWPPLDRFAYRVIGVDPSKGRTDKSDYSAFALIGLDFAGDLWIDCDMERRDVNRIAQDCVTLCRGFEPHGVALETDIYEAFAHVVKQVCFEASYMIPLHTIINTEKKITRIRQTLTPFLARHELHFKRTRGGRMLVQQLRDFPVGDYDDGPDALEMGISLLKRLFQEGGVLGQNEVRVEEVPV